MNKIFVHHRSSHHAEKSGYGRLIDYIDGQIVYGHAKFPYRVAKLFAKLHSQSAGIYNSDSFLKAIELYGLLKMSKGEKNIVHYLNGERDIRHLSFLKRRFPNTRFVATFHKPPVVLLDTIKDVSVLRKLDGAIAVGANQVEFLKEWLGLENVIYIPHGVDSQFFIPKNSLKKRNTLLFVGQHLRDFDTFNKSVPKLSSEIENLHILVVIHPAYKTKIQPHYCVEILVDIDDKQLRTLYQEATILYLPMLDSTACNSILEAMSCGLSIISSAVGGNRGYMDGTENILLKKGDINTFVSEIIGLLRDEDRLSIIGKSSRKKAEQLDWLNVMEQIDRFYQKLIL